MWTPCLGIPALDVGLLALNIQQAVSVDALGRTLYQRFPLSLDDCLRVNFDDSSNFIPVPGAVEASMARFWSLDIFTGALRLQTLSSTDIILNVFQNLENTSVTIQYSPQRAQQVYTRWSLKDVASNALVHTPDPD
ncbi:hypothetical protein BGZ79_008200 [Entomortierella chlamydospora]|nr:hypothetical protein BGZ79_008200 [Entomortierella chlamydospora]